MTISGIQISDEDSIDLRRVAGDFVIAKATYGSSGIDKSFGQYMEALKQTHKLRGALHKSMNNGSKKTPFDEASNFLNNTEDYREDCISILEWPAGRSAKSTWWAKEWLDIVTDATGKRPLIYMQFRISCDYDWTSIAKEYDLIVSAYPRNKTNGLFLGSSPYKPGHNWKVKGWNYTDEGLVSGYDKKLKLLTFYGDSNDWKSLIGESNKEEERDILSLPTVELASMTIDGKFGNGWVRKKRLASRYEDVQKEIERRLSKRFTLENR